MINGLLVLISRYLLILKSGDLFMEIHFVSICSILCCVANQMYAQVPRKLCQGPRANGALS